MSPETCQCQTPVPKWQLRRQPSLPGRPRHPIVCSVKLHTTDPPRLLPVAGVATPASMRTPTTAR